MTAPSNRYTETAHLYDLDPRPIATDDIPFLVDLSFAAAGEVLELGCGTGRVTIPVAEAGVRITGLDRSVAMLDVLRDKLRHRPEAAENIHLVEGDMTTFDLDRRFALVFVPFHTFQCLTVDEARACLARVRRHLAPGGRFMVNVYRPYAGMDDSWVQPEAFDWEVEDASGRRVRRYHTRQRIDVNAQRTWVQFRYECEDPGGIREFVEDIHMRYYREADMRSLLDSAGFSIEDAYGYYDRRPIEGEGELIFICRCR